MPLYSPPPAHFGWSKEVWATYPSQDGSQPQYRIMNRTAAILMEGESREEKLIFCSIDLQQSEGMGIVMILTISLWLCVP